MSVLITVGIDHSKAVFLTVGIDHSKAVFLTSFSDNMVYLQIHHRPPDLNLWNLRLHLQILASVPSSQHPVNLHLILRCKALQATACVGWYASTE
jgi:hypothetical protein